MKAAALIPAAREEIRLHRCNLPAGEDGFCPAHPPENRHRGYLAWRANSLHSCRAVVGRLFIQPGARA